MSRMPLLYTRRPKRASAKMSRIKTTDIAKEWLKEKLIASLKSFYEKERHLLIDELCERAVTFRLGLIMATKFRPVSVYAEYNKKHDADGRAWPKSLGLLQDISYPDLLVFSNDEPDEKPNKLVVEAKLDYRNQSSEDISHDKEKLIYFTDQDKEYRYIIGAHLLLGKDFFTIAYYENGRLSTAEQYCKPRSRWRKRGSNDPLDYYTISEFRSIIRTQNE